MKSRRPLLIATVVAALAIVVAAALLSSRVPKAATAAVGDASLAVGSAAPPFAVTTSLGAFDSSDVKTPIFLEVFATWCPHCQREVSVVNDLYRHYGSRVAFIGVCGSPYANPETQVPETQDDVNQFAQGFHVGYPLAFDPDLTVAHAYLLSGYPTIAVISGDKKVTFLDSGEISEARLRAALDASLGETPHD